MKRPLIECLFPASKKDRITFTIFLLGGPFLVWYELCHVRPRSPHNPDLLWIHICAIGFIFLQVYTNLYKMISTSVQHRKPDSGGSDHAANYCSVCKHTKPSRSHHCKLCNICVLKRDHHCWFAGYCVGYQNQRYYFLTVLYCWIAGIYAQIYYLEFVVKVLGTSFWTIIWLIGPHVPLILGYFTIYEFAVAALTSIGLLLQFVLTWLLLSQALQICKGQTRHERSKNIENYNRGLVRNIQEVFGDKWHFVWLSAFIPSLLPGNGIKYDCSETKKIN